MRESSSQLLSLLETIEYEEYNRRYYSEMALTAWREQLAELPPLVPERVRVSGSVIRRNVKTEVSDPHAARRAECTRYIRDIEEALAAMPPLTSEHLRIAREVETLQAQQRQSA